VLQAVLQEFLDAVAAGEAAVPIAKTYTMDEIATAHDDKEHERVAGELVVSRGRWGQSPRLPGSSTSRRQPRRRPAAAENRPIRRDLGLRLGLHGRCWRAAAAPRNTGIAAKSRIGRHFA
jgi:hypothetical protein